MSLVIHEEAVSAVLLADGWHEVEPGRFGLDSYEYVFGPVDDSRLSHPGGSSDVCATGFSFQPLGADRDVRVGGPLTAVLAVRYLETGAAG